MKPRAEAAFLIPEGSAHFAVRFFIFGNPSGFAVKNRRETGYSIRFCPAVFPFQKNAAGERISGCGKMIGRKAGRWGCRRREPASFPHRSWIL
jgi:hypothetical protein